MGEYVVSHLQLGLAEQEAAGGDMLEEIHVGFMLV
ncbi:MAG: hypothetical protein ACJARL_000659 [Halopseudomonas sp.]